MPSYSGTFSIEKEGNPSQPGFCRVDVEEECLTLLPQSGPPLSLDFGDIDALQAADYEVRLKIYTGETILLSRFGKSYQDLCRDLQEAHRRRLVQCLLLNDLEEIGRFEGSAELQSPRGNFFAPAEMRLYGSNIAVLPQGITALQWRLAEIDTLEFDEVGYRVLIRSGDERLLLIRLAKRTREFCEKLRAAMTDVSAGSAQTVRSVFPFLAPEQFRRVADLLREGRAARVSQLAAIHPKTEQALTEKVVSARLKPYYDSLLARSAGNDPYAGFKIIRREEEAEEPAADETPPEEKFAGPGGDTSSPAPGENGRIPDEEKQNDTEILHWFFFPLPTPKSPASPRVVAWETTSRSGRATYFFRLPEPEAGAPLEGFALGQALRQTNQALLLLNFRREPIYLSDDALEMQVRYRRYAVACRKIPILRALRSSFLGRALHTTHQAWQQQVDRIISME